MAGQLAGWGTRLREAGVGVVYLVHGSFVGADALGILREIARVWPAAGDALRRLQKQTLNNLAGDAGNFTPEYAQRLQDALQGDHPSPLPVQLFNWSGENHHVGRADGAVRLLGELASRYESTAAAAPATSSPGASAPATSLPGAGSPGERILIWAHSHGGNLLALLTNLLANDAATNERFFRAARPHYRWPGTGQIDLPAWPRAAEILADRDHPVRAARLDLVTMGTPIRYGWDPDGTANLLHFVNHRPSVDGPEYLARIPSSAEDLLQATGGDLIQQLGIAGTNFVPPLWSWRAALADQTLGSLLQAGIRKRDLLQRLRIGCRVHADGTSLLVDYGPSEGNVAQNLAGHAVYTRLEWLAFHLEQVARSFYSANGASLD